MNQDRKIEHAIVPPELAIKAMRDSGYRNTAYALAELIDNSAQANASSVELICIERPVQVNKRTRNRIENIAVLDNGNGMSSETLLLALQFGNGTHLNDRKGIGRFGMGLPNSSISQCRRVEVWTWQSGPDNALYSYLDIDEIENCALYSVPEPVAKPLPEEWRDRSAIISTSGTLVHWKKFEPHRLSWRGAKTTLTNTEMIVGRMYRKFIDKGRLVIRLLALNNDEPVFDEFAKVNDPLYLIEPSNTPDPFGKEPMFEPWGEWDEVFPIHFDGATHEVVVRMSLAQEKTLPKDGKDRGGKPYGKHAAKNLGVSIVREGRELDLDQSWTNKYEPTERWWGVEVEFPSSLDEIFGVTNNKQSTTIFSQMAQYNWRDEAQSGELLGDFSKRIVEEGDPRGLLIEVVNHIHKQIGTMRKTLSKQTAGRRTKEGRHGVEDEVEDRATDKFNERARSGYVTKSDRVVFNKDHLQQLQKDLTTDKGYSQIEAEKIASAVLARDRKVIFITKAMEGYSFFNVEHNHGGLTAIVFNTNHPFHAQLMESLNPPKADKAESDSDLLDRVHNAIDTLELIFAAWARYEMEEVSTQRKDLLFEMRQEWGKMVRFFLTERSE